MVLGIFYFKILFCIVWQFCTCIWFLWLSPLPIYFPSVPLYPSLSCTFLISWVHVFNHWIRLLPLARMCLCVRAVYWSMDRLWAQILEGSWASLQEPAGANGSSAEAGTRPPQPSMPGFEWLAPMQVAPMQVVYVLELPSVWEHRFPPVVLPQALALLPSPPLWWCGALGLRSQSLPLCTWT